MHSRCRGTGLEWGVVALSFFFLVTKTQPKIPQFVVHQYRKALTPFKRLAKLDQDYYPERMGKVCYCCSSIQF